MGIATPYFKFYVNKWLTGDISLETFEAQGLFINICAHYWNKDGILTVANLNKRFRGNEMLIGELMSCEAIKVDGERILIDFLDDQLNSKEIQKITNKTNGMKGGRPKKIEVDKPKNNPVGLFSETETEPNENPNITNIEERKGKKSNKDIIITNNTLVEVLETSPGIIDFDFTDLHLPEQLPAENLTLFSDESEFIQTEEIGEAKEAKAKSVKTKKEKDYEAALKVACLSFENEVCGFITAKFKNAWIELLQMPKWRKKPQTAVNMSLRKIMEYEEDFALICVEKAISNDYQGIVYDSTQGDYTKYLQKKSGISAPANYGGQQVTKGVQTLQMVQGAKERAKQRREANKG